MSPTITKSDGTTEEFDPKKLIASLRRAGAAEDLAEEIAEDVGRSIQNEATTHEIYSKAFAKLRENRHGAAARYSLKRAVLEFGPSGFPFEAYLAEIFRAEGFHASTDMHIQGKCVEHEVDVLLERTMAGKEPEKIFVEAKFHNAVGFKTDLQVALYVQARLEDLIAKERDAGNAPQMRGMLVTNTKFTSLAIQYAECQKLELLGWEYPVQNNLHDRIDAAGIYPITVLTTLSRAEKIALLQQKVVICSHLFRQEDALSSVGVAQSRMQDILMEAGGLCDSKKGR